MTTSLAACAAWSAADESRRDRLRDAAAAMVAESREAHGGAYFAALEALLHGHAPFCAVLIDIDKWTRRRAAEPWMSEVPDGPLDDAAALRILAALYGTSRFLDMQGQVPVDEQRTLAFVVLHARNGRRTRADFRAWGSIVPAFRHIVFRVCSARRRKLREMGSVSYMRAAMSMQAATTITMPSHDPDATTTGSSVVSPFTVAHFFDPDTEELMLWNELTALEGSCGASAFVRGRTIHFDISRLLGSGSLPDTGVRRPFLKVWAAPDRAIPPDPRELLGIVNRVKEHSGRCCFGTRDDEMAGIVGFEPHRLLSEDPSKPYELQPGECIFDLVNVTTAMGMPLHLCPVASIECNAPSLTPRPVLPKVRGWLLHHDTTIAVPVSRDPVTSGSLQVWCIDRAVPSSCEYARMDSLTQYMLSDLSSPVQNRALLDSMASPLAAVAAEILAAGLSVDPDFDAHQVCSINWLVPTYGLSLLDTLQALEHIMALAMSGNPILVLVPFAVNDPMLFGNMSLRTTLSQLAALENVAVVGPGTRDFVTKDNQFPTYSNDVFGIGDDSFDPMNGIGRLPRMKALYEAIGVPGEPRNEFLSMYFATYVAAAQIIRSTARQKGPIFVAGRQFHIQAAFVLMHLDQLAIEFESKSIPPTKGLQSSLAMRLGGRRRRYRRRRRRLHVVSCPLNGYISRCELMLMVCRAGDTELAERLVRGGVDPDSQYADTKASTLWLAANGGFPRLCVFLINNGATVDHPNSGGATPLWVACQQGLSLVLRVLVSAGASIDRPNNLGMTPAFVAAQNGHIQIVQALHDMGAHLNTPNNNRESPLWAACAYGHYNVVEFLLDFDDPRRVNRDDQSPLWAACANGHIAIVRLLLRNGVALDAADKSGRTPASVATQNGHTHIATLLENKPRSRRSITTALVSSLGLSDFLGSTGASSASDPQSKRNGKDRGLSATSIYGASPPASPRRRVTIKAGGPEVMGE